MYKIQIGSKALHRYNMKKNIQMNNKRNWDVKGNYSYAINSIHV